MIRRLVWLAAFLAVITVPLSVPQLPDSALAAGSVSMSPSAGSASSPSDQATGASAASPSSGPWCPANWQCGDIGNPRLAGAQSYTSTSWLAQGAGADIWGTVDQFHFLWSSMSGDSAVSVHLTSQTNTSSWAKAGVMMRQSTASGSPYYSTFVTPSNGIIVQYRTLANGTTAASLAGGQTPIWLKVARLGNTFSAYTSPDDVTWSLISGSSESISMPSTLLDGLAVTSHNSGVLSTAGFASAQVAPVGGGTATNTPVPTPTSVPPVTATSTSVPPVATSTPVPPTATSTATPTMVPSSAAIALGAYIAGSPSDGTAIDNYASEVGRMPAIVMWYQTWGEYYNYWSDRVADNVTSRGATPMITWEPWNGSNPDPTYKLTSITAGNFDTYIRTWATAAKAWGHPFFLRFAAEMNGSWYPWGTKSGNAEGNSPSDYIAAWRHVHDIFTSVGCTNAIWVWSPNTTYTGSVPYSQIYPGDSYVDWAGVDGYNSGPLEPTGWTSLLNLFSPSYLSLTSLTSKPLMIGETASTESGGSKSDWITQGFLTDLPTYFPRIKAVTWFDVQKETDWQVDSSTASLAAWRSVVASPLFQGKAP